MLGRHLEFIKERQYVMNVSAATIRWYTSALKWLDTEVPTQEDLTRLVVKMREQGLKATGCNAATRAINAYLHWASGATGKCGGGCRHPHIKPMKEPEFVPSVFTDDQVKKLVNFRASARDGSFKIVGIAPGEYTLFAWEHVDAEAYFDPDFLAKSQDFGRRVIIRQNSSQILDVTVIPVD